MEQFLDFKGNIHLFENLSNHKMSNSTPISYLILKSPEEFSEKSTVIQQDENIILENLVQKYSADQNIENAIAIWDEIAKEFMSVVNIEVTGEDLQKVKFKFS